MSEPNPSPVPPPGSTASASQRSVVILCYALLLLAWMNGVTAVIAVIIAYLKRDEAAGTVWQSHYRNMISVFIATLIVFLIMMFSWPLALGSLFVNGFVWPFPAALGFGFLLWMVVFPLFALWYLYRTIRGLLLALDERAY